MQSLNFNWKNFTVLATSALLLGACGNEETQETLVDGDSIELTLVPWDSEIASTTVIGTVLEDIGYDVTLTSVDLPVMWSAVAEGQADAMVSAWLPHTNISMYDRYGETMENLGTNMYGARIGLVVPEYMDVDSISDLTDEADQTIIGIEAGAGVVEATEEAFETYDNLEGWTLNTSSGGAMATSLGEAIQNGEEVIVTGWSPHWIFQSYDVKYLEDEENLYGDEERVDTFVREGLQDDHPVAYSVLENFFWETDDVEAVMVAMSEGSTAEQAARDWIDNNQELVSEWIAEAEEIAETENAGN